MQRNRPTAVLVMAILNFVMGAIYLLSYSCGGLALIGLRAMKNMAPPAGKGPNPFGEMYDMYESIPGFIALTITFSILAIAMAILLIVAGMGLLKMRPWARQACVAYSIYGILSGLFSFVYTLTLANPAIVKWQEETMQRQGRAIPSLSSISGSFSDFFAFAGLLWALAYPIALLIVLYRPSVSAAFAEQSVSPAFSGRPG